MKILHVTPRIDAAAGGPAYSIPSLAQALLQAGAEVDLHVLIAGPAQAGAARTHCHPPLPILKKLGISPSLRRSLHQAAGQANILHSHGLWRMANIYPAGAVWGKVCRLVTSPRGMLSRSALAHSRVQKRLMWLLYQARALRASHCFHATSEGEYQDIRAAGLKAPVAIIPNGVDIPPLPTRSAGPPARRSLLFLGRLHPFKRVDVLLQAWRQVQDRFRQWDLEIVGPDEGGHLQQLRHLAEKLGVQRVSFLGPAYGPAKGAALCRAQLLVLPSYSENFGMAVAEALAHETPVIVNRGAPWSGVETHGCGWWIEGGAAPLAEALVKALSLSPQELAEMGARGREWVAGTLAWERIAQMMLDTYRWLLGGGERPGCVLTD